MDNNRNAFILRTSDADHTPQEWEKAIRKSGGEVWRSIKQGTLIRVFFLTGRERGEVANCVRRQVNNNFSIRRH